MPEPQVLPPTVLTVDSLHDRSVEVRADAPSLKREIRSVGRHSLIYLLGPALANAVSFVLIPIYTYYIDRSDYGVMSLVDVVITMGMMILSLGASDGLARHYYEETDEDERRRLISAAVLGPALLSLPLVLLAMLLADGLRRSMGIEPHLVTYVRLALVVAWLSMIAEIGNAYLRMCYLAKTFVALTVIQIVGAVSLNLLFVVQFNWGIWGILYSSLIVQGVLAVVLTTVLLVRSARRPRWSHLARLLGFGLHLVPSTVALQLSNYLSPLMLRWWLVGDPVAVLAQIGLFAMGQKMGVVVNRFVTVPFNAFWRPRRMELVVSDQPAVRHILARMCTYSTLATCQVALGLSLAAEPLLRLLVAPKYWDAWRVVPWIAAAYVILSLEHHFVTGMHYARRTQWATLIGGIALLALIITNGLAVPRWGMVGAAAATLVSVTVRSLLFGWISQRLYPIPYELGRLASMGVVSLAVYSLTAQAEFNSAGLSLAARLAGSAGLIPILGLLGFFSAEELAEVRIACRRRWQS